ncbi:hypothetical protein EYR36_001056 [Pleurotus pulmonarius]|nr:hypothetical protein EYR36_004321 [Pleurotus pulmonarius]KAF4579246.1 hypothetical protein EYR36_001056 [Pleurotus pulmonarius]KAF4603414.1 hypothetical protein EYR38_003827 [Pleurotus pulmonarius]
MDNASSVLEEHTASGSGSGSSLNSSDSGHPTPTKPSSANFMESFMASIGSERECEEFAFQLLASLPRSHLATIRRRIAPLLQFDLVGSLPIELALQVFSHLTAQTLWTCALVNRRWRTLADDPALWKALCDERGWVWKDSSNANVFESNRTLQIGSDPWDDSDDEGMGASDEEDDEQEDATTTSVLSEVEKAKIMLTQMHAELDSGFASMSTAGNSSFFGNLSFSSSSTASGSTSNNTVRIAARQSTYQPSGKFAAHNSAPPLLRSASGTFSEPDYKLLYQTHIRLYNRFVSSSFRLRTLPKRGYERLSNAHTNTIYCLQLYTYPSGKQVLFTGSRDRTVREWNLRTEMVERVISGVHESSVLSICVHNGFLASAGSDRRVAVWDLTKDRLVKVICDHDDSVLCVRFDDEKLVSCSKDRTVRTYTFPDLVPQFVLGAHRAAVNAVSISKSLIVSASGDRSIRLWDTKTGALLQTFENHHSRGIASIDFKPPFVLSGSSDKHLRFFDVTSLKGWSTSPELHYEGNTAADAAPPLPLPTLDSNWINLMMCQACGCLNSVNTMEGGTCDAAGLGASAVRAGPAASSANSCTPHRDLVRSVALGEHFVLSGSYDLSIKVRRLSLDVVLISVLHEDAPSVDCVGI